MTMPCPNCGATLADGAHRCPACDALAPVAAEEPTAEAPTEAMPWAIPIREGTVSQPDRDPLRPALYGVLVMAVLAGVVVIAAQMLGGGGGGEVAGDPDVTGEAADVRGDAADVRDAADPSTSTTGQATETTSTTNTTTTTTTTTTTAPPTTSTTVAPTTTRPASPGTAPQLPASFGGGWVAQLTSVPVSAGPDAAEQAWSRARAYASGAVVTRSDDWSSLAPGYWVIVDEGPFASADDVRSFCASVASTDTGNCLPRELTGRR